MSALPVADLPLEADLPAQRLRRTAAAVRVHFTWWGVHRTLTPQQKEEVGDACGAEARLLTAGKKIIDTRHEAFRKLTSLRSRIVSYWRGLTLPYVEPGVRLIKQADLESFVHTLEGYQEELRQAEEELSQVYGQMRADARERLGKLYNPADYPEEIHNLFSVAWDFPSIEPPAYLLRLSPEVYRQEQQRVSQRFEEAVRLAEEAFATEFSRLVAHLTERLGSDGGQRRVFRDSAVTNLLEFFERFKQLNLHSNQELDTLVAQVQELVRGVAPQELRDRDGLRQEVALALGQVQGNLDSLIVERPRRQLIRATASRNGGSHAPDH